METEGNKPLEQGESTLMQPFLLIPQRTQLLSSYQMVRRLASLPVGLRLSLHQKWKQLGTTSLDRSPGSSPPKKQATEEVEESLPPCEAALPRGMSKKDILPKRYEVFTTDYDWVQTVPGSLLGLEAGASPSRRDIDNSSHFVPRMTASESDLPEVITEHWLPILRREGLLVECPPRLVHHPSRLDPSVHPRGSAEVPSRCAVSFLSQGAPSLIAVAPPEFCVGTDKEFLLCNFHHHQCLMRQSFNLEGRCRQLAFCPYCGDINENSNMAFSHVRKHLDLQFVCGGCYSKSFLNGPALNKHMKGQCPSMSAIKDHSKSSRR